MINKSNQSSAESSRKLEYANVTLEPVISLLKKHKASVTQNRVAILSLFFQYPAGISSSQVRNLSLLKLDRISVYRTIRFLLQKRIIAAIPTSRSSSLYILDSFLPAPGRENRAGQLLYFVCHCCGKTRIQELAKPVSYRCPAHYQINHAYVVAEGICGPCKIENQINSLDR